MHKGNVRRHFGKSDRCAARRIFLTCFGALLWIRSAAVFPLRRAFQGAGALVHAELAVGVVGGVRVAGGVECGGLGR